ncbi:MAG: hypothetical protein WC584_03840 [Candidatus Pacearchaeota archaeon]
MRRKFRTSAILIVLIILVLISILFYFYNFTTLPKNLDNFFNQKKQNQNNEDNTENNNINQNIPDNNPQTAGSSNEGNSEGQTATQNSIPTNPCVYKQITYSIGDLTEYYFCNSEESRICVDKTAKCSVKIKNLDDTLGGNFAIKFSFAEKENRSNIIITSTSNSIISPNEQKILKSELVIQGNNADKNLSCYYSTTEIPKEKICS